MKRNLCILLCFVGCIMLMSSCEKENTLHSLSSWLSTDYPADEFVLFITDPEIDIMFESTSGGKLSIESADEFVIGVSSWSWFTYGFTCSMNATIRKPSHVGSTYLHIYNSEHSALIKVQVLPQYYIYTEPGLDFDDTEDSVRSKLANPVLFYDPANRTYQVVDVHGNYNLQIFYAEDGTIDHYVVTLLNHPSEGELRGYIEERYYYYRTTVNQLPIYIKAFNEHNPSISDATVVVILDLESSTITYQNPVTYNN